MTSIIKVDFVDAIFGGKLVRFRFKGDDILAGLFVKSPYEVFKRFSDGRWTLDDVRNVLVWSDPRARSCIAPDIDRVLRSPDHSIIGYAALAARILEAISRRDRCRSIELRRKGCHCMKPPAGLDAMLKQLKTAPDEVRTGLRGQFSQDGATLVAEMKARAPKKTGALQASIKATPADNGIGVKITAGGLTTRKKIRKGVKDKDAARRQGPVRLCVGG